MYTSILHTHQELGASFTAAVPGAGEEALRVLDANVRSPGC